MKFRFGSNQLNNKLVSANAARDAKDWGRAAKLYIEYLDAAPNEFNIVVQLGNCLKESGDFDAALEAYVRAINLREGDSDVYLQKGHVLKLMGRQPEALMAYQIAYDLDDQNTNAKLELEHYGTLAISSKNKGRLGRAAGVKTIWLDVTDFMDYAKVNTSLSGIQRVVANLAIYIKAFKSDEYRIVPVIPEYDRLRILSVRPQCFLDLVDSFDETVVSRDKVDLNIQNVYASRVEITPAKDDIFVIAGAFWIFDHYDVIIDLRRNGMRFGLFVHDLIQIRNDEYVMPDAVDKFQIHLNDALDVCDFVLTNSEFVASEVRDYMRLSCNYSLPVKAVLLPTELRQTSQTIRVSNKDIQEMGGERYVLCVSTIEVRKNHDFLIKTWEKLRRDFGEETPYLVLVGKWGWQIDDFRKYIDEQGYVGDWLYIYNGISDVEMEYLYRNSLFTVYPSFAEGFGLPIGESLVFGKPCVASKTTSMPEVGGDFVRYIDPYDVDSSYPVFRELLSNPDDLASWERRIQQEFIPRTWREFCGEFYFAVIEFGSKQRLDYLYSNCQLPSSTFIEGGDHNVLQLAKAREKIITFRSCRTKNWHPMEHWGVWSSSRRANISFKTDLEAGVDVEVFLRINRPAGAEALSVLLVNCGKGSSTVHISENMRIFRFSGVVNSDGGMDIEFLARGKYPSVGGRSIFVGLSGIAYCRSNLGFSNDVIDCLIPRSLS
ncbi:glycosyltransferase [Frateuria aurantia]